MSVLEIEKELISLSSRKKEKVILKGLISVNENQFFRIMEDYFDIKDSIEAMNKGEFVAWEKVRESIKSKKNNPIKRR